jgi:hypothetical protein
METTAQWSVRRGSARLLKAVPLPGQPTAASVGVSSASKP